MTRAICKGTLLQHDISSTMTTIAQVISIDKAEDATEVFEADTLDNSGAGIPMDPTGRATGGNVTAEYFLDPVLSGHQLLTDDITTPAKRDYNIQLADAAATDWPFTVAGIGVGFRVALNDGLKGQLTLTLDGIPTYPT